MFTINRSLLATELAVVQAAAEKKTTIPILSFVLVQVVDGIAKLTATDTDITVTTQVEAEGKPYSGCIPIRQLSSLVKLLEGDSIQFTEKPNGRIEIKAGTSKHLLPTLREDQFPSVEHVDGENVTIPGAKLGTMIHRTVFCAGQENDGQRYTFQCVHFEIENKILTVVATNSRQFGAMTALVDTVTSMSALVPVRAALALERLCEAEGEIQFKADANHARFESGNRTLTARLVVGEFPAWRLVIPESLEHQVVVAPERLAASVKRACVTTRESKLIRHPLELSFSKQQLQITSQSEDGESTDIVPINCKSLNGSEIGIKVNGEHFINFISRTEGQISCSFNDDKRLIQLGIEGDPDFKYITMALR